ncbi:HEAT repeat-containing protein 1 [Cyanidiococcus yangmingshanensis]|uniref:HEAT repeat-containing protein 1 n=1 Tax=Cyanidiococcus yangmingshanensis TaxID=2690220 RepID=A0A7J7IM09_9RHOD|nr:HEAT repeat-containing protein 1 [Cyanidiococcus yangmingshanensis]
MSRLQQQLEAIRSQEESHGILGASHCSVLFPADVAKRVSWSELAALARNGLIQLMSVDERFGIFEESALFHRKYVLQGETVPADLDRGQHTKAAEAEMRALVQRFCLLLVPHFTTKPAQKCVEWLLRAHSVGALEPEALITAALPYVSTEAFQRLITALRLAYNAAAKTRWHWLDRVHRFHDLVEHSIDLNWFIPFLWDTASDLLRARIAASPWNRLLLRYGCAAAQQSREVAGRLIRSLTTILMQCGQVSHRDRLLWQEFWYACLGVLIVAFGVMESVRKDLFLATARALVRLYEQTRVWYPEDPSWQRRLLKTIAVMYARHPQQPFPPESYEQLACCEEWYAGLAALDSHSTEALLRAYGMVAIDRALKAAAWSPSWRPLVSRIRLSRALVYTFIEQILLRYERFAETDAGAIDVKEAASWTMHLHRTANQSAEMGESPVCTAHGTTTTNSEDQWNVETKLLETKHLVDRAGSEKGRIDDTACTLECPDQIRSTNDQTEWESATSNRPKQESTPSLRKHVDRIEQRPYERVSIRESTVAADPIDSKTLKEHVSVDIERKSTVTLVQPSDETRTQTMTLCVQALEDLLIAAEPAMFWDVVQAIEQRMGDSAWWRPLWNELQTSSLRPSALLHHHGGGVRSQAVRLLSHASPREQDQSLDLILELMKRPDGFEESLHAELESSGPASRELNWLDERLTRLGAEVLEPLLPRHTGLYLRAKGSRPVRALVRAYAASVGADESARPSAGSDSGMNDPRPSFRILEAAYQQLCACWHLPPETNTERTERQCHPPAQWFTCFGNLLARLQGVGALEILLVQLLDQVETDASVVQPAAALSLALVAECNEALDIALVWRVLASGVGASMGEYWVSAAYRIVRRLNEIDVVEKPRLVPSAIIPLIRRVFEVALGQAASTPHPNGMDLLAETILWTASQSTQLECEAVRLATNAGGYGPDLIAFLAEAGVDVARWLSSPSMTIDEACSCLALVAEFFMTLGIASAAVLLERVAALPMTGFESSTLASQRRQTAATIIQRAIHVDEAGPAWQQWRTSDADEDIGRLLASCVRLTQPLRASDWLSLQPLWELPAPAGLPVVRLLLLSLRDAIEQASMNPEIPAELVPAVIVACRWLCASASDALGPALYLPVQWIAGLLQTQNTEKHKGIDRWLFEAIEMQCIRWGTWKLDAAKEAQTDQEPVVVPPSTPNPWCVLFERQFTKAWKVTRDADQVLCLLSIARNDATARAALLPQQIAALVSAPLETAPIPSNWRRCSAYAETLLVQYLIDAGATGSALEIDQMEALLGGIWKRYSQLSESERTKLLETMVGALTTYASKTTNQSASLWSLVYTTASAHLPWPTVGELLKQIVYRDTDALVPLVSYLSTLRRGDRRAVTGTQQMPPVAAAAGARSAKAPSAAALDRLAMELLRIAQARCPSTVRQVLMGAATPLLQLAPRYLNLRRIFGSDSTAEVVMFLEHPHLPMALLKELITNVWPLETIREAIVQRPHESIVSILLDYLERFVRNRAAQRNKNRRQQIVETLQALGPLLLDKVVEPELLRRWLRNPLTSTAGLSLLPRLATLTDTACVAAAIRTFGLQTIPYLPQVMRLWPAPAIVQAMLEALPNFVSAAYIRELWQTIREHCPHDRDREAIRILLVESVTPLSLLEAARMIIHTEDCFGVNPSGEEALRCLSIALTSWKSPLIQRHLEQLLAIIWQAMQTREYIVLTKKNAANLDTCITAEPELVETLSVDAFVAMALQLSDSDFADALYRSMLWSMAPASDDVQPLPQVASEADTESRKRQRLAPATEPNASQIATAALEPNWRLLVWFKLIRALAERLDTLFQRHVELVWDQVLMSAQQKDPEKGTSVHIHAYTMRVRLAALDALTACLATKRDTCLSAAECDACLSVASWWLSKAASSSPSSATDNDAGVSVLERFIAGLAPWMTHDVSASHAVDTSPLLQRLHRLLTAPTTVLGRRGDLQSRRTHQRMRARLMRVLVETLADRFLPLLPSTLPWLAEALESTDELIEQVALDIGERLSKITGEDIFAQLRETPAV